MLLDYWPSRTLGCISHAIDSRGVRQDLFFQPCKQVKKLSQLRLLKRELAPTVNMTPDDRPTRIHDQKIGVQVIPRRLVPLSHAKYCWECPHPRSVVKLEQGTESVRRRLWAEPARIQVSHPAVFFAGPLVLGIVFAVFDT